MRNASRIGGLWYYLWLPPPRPPVLRSAPPDLLPPWKPLRLSPLPPPKAPASPDAAPSGCDAPLTGSGRGKFTARASTVRLQPGFPTSSHVLQSSGTSVLLDSLTRLLSLKDRIIAGSGDGAWGESLGGAAVETGTPLLSSGILQRGGGLLSGVAPKIPSVLHRTHLPPRHSAHGSLHRDMLHPGGGRRHAATCPFESLRH